MAASLSCIGLPSALPLLAKEITCTRGSSSASDGSTPASGSKIELVGAPVGVSAAVGSGSSAGAVAGFPHEASASARAARQAVLIEGGVTNIMSSAV